MEEQNMLKDVLETHPAVYSSSSNEQETRVPLLLGISPLAYAPLSNENISQIEILESAEKHRPHITDSERIRQILPRDNYTSPPYYPRVLPSWDTVEFYERLGTETLFFIFYYMEGTKAQYLAAEVLKSRLWTFHAERMIWIKCDGDPQIIKQINEQGAYLYFDYENWIQRRNETLTGDYQ